MYLHLNPISNFEKAIYFQPTILVNYLMFANKFDFSRDHFAINLFDLYHFKSKLLNLASLLKIRALFIYLTLICFFYYNVAIANIVS